MSVHALLGGSGAHRWLKCHASAILTHRNPTEDKSGRAAEEGTLAHKLLEQCLNEKTCPTTWKGLTLYAEDEISAESDVEGLFVDEDVANAVKVAYDYITQVSSGVDLLVEQQVEYNNPEMPKPIQQLGGIYGTADAIIHSAQSHLIVADYKHGAGTTVLIENNAQIMFYLVCAVNSLYDGVYDPMMRYVGVIIQPRCFGNADIQEAVYSAAELQAFDLKMQDAIRSIYAGTKGNDNAMKYEVGDHCTFCPHMATCAAKVQQAEEVAMTAFASAEVDTPTLEDKLPDVSTLTDEQRVQVLRYGNDVIKWIGAVCARAESDAKIGIQIPGYKLVERKGNAVWKDETAAIEALTSAGHDVHTITKTSLLTQTALKKICGVDAIEALTERPPKGLTLVAESDKREGVIPEMKGLPE